MALEPITRQEQIIAGKDLEPITRMEKFLKEYGGTSSGISIRKAVFTDRPSFYEWLLDNDSNVIYCNVLSTQNPWRVNLLVHRFVEDMSDPTVGVGFGLVQINSFGGNTLVPSSIQITENNTTFTIDETINVNQDGTITGGYVEPTVIPDEYWPALQVEFTVYYFDE